MRDSATALIRFRHSASGSGVSRTGHIRPGGKLTVEYDAARLPAETGIAGTAADIVCHVRFGPGGQTYAAGVPTPAASASASGSAALGIFDVAVPADATSVELWFEGRGPGGTVGWDSRYGANYAFAITGEGLPVPEPSVVLRPKTLVDPGRIRVVADAASKAAATIGRAGSRLETGLVIRVLIADPVDTIEAWADIHVFDGADELIQAGSVVLEPCESTPEGALFEWQDVIYQGSGGGSGMGVWSRPDAQTIQYRVYGQTRAQAGVAFTDDILHEFEVLADFEASRLPT